MAFLGEYDDEADLAHSIAYALQQSGALKRKDRMDEPQHRVARLVIDHLKLCGYVITPPSGTKPPTT